MRPGLATLAVCSVADDAVPTGVSGTSRTPALTGGPPSADDDRGTETSAAPGQRLCVMGAAAGLSVVPRVHLLSPHVH